MFVVLKFAIISWSHFLLPKSSRSSFRNSQGQQSEKGKRWNVGLHCPSFGFEKRNQFITKNYWKWKKGVCVRWLWVINCTWNNLQIADHKSVDQWAKRRPSWFCAWQWGLCALRQGIQISMEAFLACHPARSTEWPDCHPKSCELWRIRTGQICRLFLVLFITSSHLTHNLFFYFH